MSPSLLASGSLSDFTITCAGKSYKVHRVLLMCHSEYFKTCFEGQFKEAREDTIDLKVRYPPYKLCRWGMTLTSFRMMHPKPSTR